MDNGKTEVYQLPKYRALENSHILLWLIKDTCWALEFETGGIAMIAPTLGMAIYLTWCTWKSKPEFFHNIAICLWIIANSVWMIGEFNDQDWRQYAVVFFAAGLLILVFYYLFWFRRGMRATRQPAPATQEQ